MSMAISMSGRMIGSLHVLDRAPSMARHAAWWVRCEQGHEWIERGDNLRRMERGKWQTLCLECAEVAP